jgi:hypothetical protein
LATKISVGFEVLTAVVNKTSVFWDITPCSNELLSKISLKIERFTVIIMLVVLIFILYIAALVTTTTQAVARKTQLHTVRLHRNILLHVVRVY